MSDVQIIPRKTWGARHPAGFGARALPTSTAWLHHTVTPRPAPTLADESRAMRDVESIGQSRFGAGFSYNLAVMPSGRIYEGCGIDRVGAHTKGLNTTALGVVLVGDYSRSGPTPEQVTALAHLLQTADRLNWIDQPRFDGGHRDAPNASTACPGQAAWNMIAEINRRAAGPMIGTDPTPNQAVQEDSMQYVAIQREDGAIALTAPGFFLHVSPEAWAVAQRTGQAKPPVDQINAREWDVARAIALGGEEPEQERAAD